MKQRDLKVMSGCALLCVMAVGVFAFLPTVQYRRLQSDRENALRLLSQPGKATFVDRLVGALHRTPADSYYLHRWESTQKALLASGLLVETKIAISDMWSSFGIYEELRRIERQTGAYWWATIDLTNQIVMLTSKPKDVAAFTAALQSKRQPSPVE